MILHKKSLWLIIIVCLITVTGCAGPKRTRLLEARWGNSFEFFKNNQIVNQKPPQKKMSTPGVSGKITEIGMDKYYYDLTTIEKVETSIGGE